MSRRSKRPRAKRSIGKAVVLATILGLLSGYKDVLLPLVSALIGWLLPSPIQKAQKESENVHNTEKAVSDGTAPTSDLDRLP